ncbi:MAG: hypothetical protein VCG02_04710, partial [Verrucomicrobiota bacterium]
MALNIHGFPYLLAAKQGRSFCIRNSGLPQKVQDRLLPRLPARKMRIASKIPRSQSTLRNTKSTGSRS